MNIQKNPCEVTTGEVRLSYVHLLQPKMPNNPNDKPKYSVSVLLPKSDVQTKQAIDLAIEAAKQQGAQKVYGGVLPPQVAIPIHDGDGVKPSDGMPYGEECKGNYVFTASNTNPVDIVDSALNPILVQAEIYSGMFARVALRFFPYNAGGKKGVGCSLGAVQKLRDGAPLVSRITAQSAFGIPAMPQAPAYAPILPTAPPVAPIQPTGQPIQQPPIFGL